MAQCPKCGYSTYYENSDIMPPPPGTNWLPLPRKWWACSRCGYDSRYATKSDDRGCADAVFFLIPLMIGIGICACSLSYFGEYGDKKTGIVIALFGAGTVVVSYYFYHTALKAWWRRNK